MNGYAKIIDVGVDAESGINNPLSYCVNNVMDQRFLHGGHADTLGQHSRNCQLFLSEYCAQGWDGYCELASENQATWLPDEVGSCLGCGAVNALGLNAGEVLIRNTAARKYLVEMVGAHLEVAPFDPTVASSPNISWWEANSCCSGGNAGSGLNGIPIYAVDPAIIDDDIVMDKILMRPVIAIDILKNIFNTMKRHGTLKGLVGTKLGHFYMSNPQYFK